MKYRIKIITWGNGRKTYYAYVKKGFMWIGLDYGGSVGYATERETREGILGIIDKHFIGYSREQTIEFEYINTIRKSNNQ